MQSRDRGKMCWWTECRPGQACRATNISPTSHQHPTDWLTDWLTDCSCPSILQCFRLQLISGRDRDITETLGCRLVWDVGAQQQQLVVGWGNGTGRDWVATVQHCSTDCSSYTRPPRVTPHASLPDSEARVLRTGQAWGVWGGLVWDCQPDWEPCVSLSEWRPPTPPLCTVKAPPPTRGTSS